jgi:hypothetical protein
MPVVGLLVLVVLFILFYASTNGTSRGEQESRARSRSSLRRAPFKAQYGLNTRQSIEEFECRMLQGMSATTREVAVTAFCRDGVVLGVFANVGSRRQVHSTADVNLWPDRARKLGATHLRRYHSHPPGLGCSVPSTVDSNSHLALKEFLEQHDLRIESFLVYPRLLGGMAVRPYGRR